VLGNGNLAQATTMKMRGQRWGGAAWWLGKKNGVGEKGVGERAAGERGAMGRGKAGPEIISSRGNKGGKIEKHGGGRVEDREEPSMAASVQTGHMAQMM
jgi:hypothetical protein